ncbi:unnamed protein product, partial [marine sediment metagenome]
MYIVSLYNACISLIEGNIFVAWIALILAFIILAKCADIFVDSS